jgi:hypothetical protein
MDNIDCYILTLFHIGIQSSKFTRSKRLTSTHLYCVSTKDTVARVKDALCNTILNGDKLAEEVGVHIQNRKEDILF